MMEWMILSSKADRARILNSIVLVTMCQVLGSTIEMIAILIVPRVLGSAMSKSLALPPASTSTFTMTS